MEPADLNPPAGDDPQIEAWLRRPAPTLRDDGFSARVLASLPPAAKTVSRPWYRIALCLTGAGLGCVVGFTQHVPWAESVAPLAMLADPLAIAALGVSILSVLFAFRTEVRERFMP
jgi:hypothetical protein